MVAESSCLRTGSEAISQVRDIICDTSFLQCLSSRFRYHGTHGVYCNYKTLFRHARSLSYRHGASAMDAP